ncbi:NAD(P)-dependent oxidoreductase [Ruicaihuangia caeni]|uniref:NAD(P)-dependent oxidoreductase n=1 Tax=Ruicaihuangia caeni TaxID=3042517 RepID=UPI00338EDDB7
MIAGRIGVVGLGAMGGGVARFLFESGRDTTEYDALESTRARARDAGRPVAASISELCTAADWVFLFLPGPAEVRQAVDAILAADATVRGVLDFTTSDPTVSRSVAAELAASGIDYADAGVLGNPPLARTGSLLLLLGCPRGSDLAEVAELVSKRCFFLGETGSGHAAKLAANELFTAQVAAMAEAMTLLHRLGVDQEVFLEALGATGGRGVGLADIGRTMLQPPEEAGFALRLAAKDLALLSALNEQAEAGLAVAPALAGLFARAAKHDPDADYTAVYGELVRSAGAVPAEA